MIVSNEGRIRKRYYNFVNEDIIRNPLYIYVQGGGEAEFICVKCNYRPLYYRSSVINHIKTNMHRGIINENTPKDIQQIWLAKL